MPKDFLKDARDRYDVIVIGSGLAGLTAANVLGAPGTRCCCSSSTTSWAAGHLVQAARRPHLRHLAARLPARHDQELPPLLEPRDRRLDRPAENIRFDNPMFSLTTTFNREDFTRLLIERFGIAPRRSRVLRHGRGMNFYDDQR
jgi:flavin-dependent dehydrogenase